MRTRRSLSLLMGAVLAVALGLACFLEVRDWGAARRARMAYIRVHLGRARNYDAELAGPPPFWPMSQELRRALLRLSIWHARRAEELQRAGRFDVEAERLRDRQTSPNPNDEQVREWLLDYHYPRSI